MNALFDIVSIHFCFSFSSGNNLKKWVNIRDYLFFSKRICMTQMKEEKKSRKNEFLMIITIKKIL